MSEVLRAFFPRCGRCFTRIWPWQPRRKWRHPVSGRVGRWHDFH